VLWKKSRSCLFLCLKQKYIGLYNFLSNWNTTVTMVMWVYFDTRVSNTIKYPYILTSIRFQQCLLINKIAQLSLTNPRDAKACQKLLQFGVLTTLPLTILAYLHSFSCRCVRNLRNPAKFTENSNLWSSRSSKVIDLGVNRKPMYDFLLVTNSNFVRICYRFRDIVA